jgi:Flp pilus assembly protein TadD
LGDKILQSGENFEEAVEHLRMAVELDSVHVASHFALGRALAGLKRNDEAKMVLNAGIDAALSGRSNGGGDLVPEMRTLIQTLG